MLLSRVEKENGGGHTHTWMRTRTYTQWVCRDREKVTIYKETVLGSGQSCQNTVLGSLTSRAVRE